MTTDRPSLVPVITRRGTAGSLNIVMREPLPLQTRTHRIDVEAELARCVALTLRLLVGGAPTRPFERLGGGRAGDDAHTVVVGDNRVAGVDQRAGAHERLLNRAERLFH